ncbi:DegT/DnrJ/EryC1/StrS family aminotransferase [candidate division CSSED10-310 bacterium]|uniref:DegT/DnrJ/EryC1/StrS family aminotransferase n=1 Tax=candidate division CSSED10-310 bacterium TaxID=2855610 RepID=A0ABV6YV95_UNCC1
MNVSSKEFFSKTQPLKQIEKELLDQTGCVSVKWCGRAATALYWSYQLTKSIREEVSQPEVILPAISCTTPANTAMLAGLQPRFADVHQDTGMLGLLEIQQRFTENTVAVVFIHLYGHTRDLTAINKWCRERNVLLIEDIAQAHGARFPNGRLAGSVGDFSVYSFNPTKLLECGGGALMIRSAEHEKIMSKLEPKNQVQKEPEADIVDQLGLSYRNLHHSLVTLFRMGADAALSTAFLQIRSAFDAMYLKRTYDSKSLAEAWSQLPGILERRRRKAEIYKQKLKGGPWQTLDGWQKSGVCWRYSLLVDFPEKVVVFSKRVRSDGFHVSNLYWPVNHFFKPDDECYSADDFARRIVNLWVDDSVDEDWVRQCAESMQKNAAFEI